MASTSDRQSDSSGQDHPNSWSNTEQRFTKAYRDCKKQWVCIYISLKLICVDIPNLFPTLDGSMA
ncbi:hypothetical protein ANOM_007165 [Aspergillus nomiae NRRL 13137]|uniref:Uncharacterized protein n=1 Tax=Aspergillus nomiae NRRL (strain ATCC 15546 / NRRL 13137 / CBS 260.88 / M93) TaxID=1509407 RepID=A0A0L1IXI0_ASPN3|nr:uncharacterized protein ANOM_007165 [Aspergillus nomiae NRRL 13137]KNG84115.1 hypothetical protein ANOM_007165 [Aspergillus nomiae NRRL 13137]